MDAIEQAIRNAFAKGDPADPAFREKVYRWAYSVVDKAVAAKQGLSAGDADRQRRRALAAIERVESEFQPAAEPQAKAPASPGPPVAPPPASDTRAAPPPGPAGQTAAPGTATPEVGPPEGMRREPAPPSVGPDSGHGQAPSPDWPDVVEAADRADPSRPLAGDPSPDAQRRVAATVGGGESRRRFPWGMVIGLSIIAVVAVLALWTAAELGLLRLSSGDGGIQTRNGSSDAGPAMSGDGQALEDWIVIFSPSDPTTVRASSGASAEVIGSGEEQAMRISSGPGGAAVVFDIGQGILERLAGRRAMFDILARTGDGPETQMSVTCSLGKLGECGRNRYTVARQPTEYLFEVDVPEGAPGSAGAIAIVSDVDNGGKSVEILEIRVTTASQ